MEGGRAGQRYKICRTVIRLPEIFVSCSFPFIHIFALVMHLCERNDSFLGLRKLLHTRLSTFECFD